MTDLTTMYTDHMTDDLLDHPDDSAFSAQRDYDLYLSLLLKRDQADKEARQIHLLYTRTFGRLLIACLEQKIACIRCKKALAFYQRALNHGKVINPAELMIYLDTETSLYNTQLNQLLLRHDASKRAEPASHYAVKRSREIYRRLAKLLHPDINPHTDKTKQLQDLWQDILDAYFCNNVKKLSELECMTGHAFRELGLEYKTPDIPDLSDRIRELRREIYLICHTEPYTFRALLEDEEASSRKKQELQKELSTWEDYHRQLDECILETVRKEGIEFSW